MTDHYFELPLVGADAVQTLDLIVHLPVTGVIPGSIYFVLEDGNIYTYTGSAWVKGAGGGGGSGTVTQVDTGTGLTGGPITMTGTVALADTAVTPASYGSATQVSTFTVDQQGRLTAAGNTTIAIPGSAVSGNIAGNAANVTGTVAVGHGGTNSTTALNNNRVMQSSGGAIVEAAAITASRAIASDSNGIPVAATTTATELGYVAGVTSAIQTQLNAKQATLTLGNLTDAGTDGLVVTGGTGAVVGSGTSIAQHVADTTHNGYLSSTDWNTFNGKQAAGSYVTSLTGDATASGPGAAATTIAIGAVTDTKSSLATKPSIALVATTNLGLSGLADVIDGSSPAADTLVLATAQSTGSQNGPWQAQVGAWTRPTWYPSGGTTQAFQFISTFVRLGTVYQGSTWRMTTSGAITIDTTATTWVVAPLAINSSTTNITLTSNRVLKSASGVIVEAAAITAAKALVSDANGIPVAATTSTTELNYVAGVTSAIQTQLNTKLTAANNLSDIGTPSTARTNLGLGTIATQDASNVSITGGLITSAVALGALVALSGNTTLSTTDVGGLYSIDTTSAAFSVTLPAASTIAANRSWLFIDIGGVLESNNLTFVRNGSDQIGGVAANFVYTTNFGGVRLVSDGVSKWLVV